MSKRPDLDTFYYHDHFMEMIGFVTEVYEHCLDEDEKNFLENFKALPIPAQCLFIRMVNRKSEIFSRRNLDYDEIDCIGDVIEILKTRGFARLVGAHDYGVCLLSLKKQDLLALALREDLEGVRESWDKRRLARHIESSLPMERVLGDDIQFFRACHLKHVGYLLYLYFGKTRESLTSFALRDLGLVRVREGTQFAARFRDESEARHAYFYLSLLKNFREADHAGMELFAFEAHHWPEPQSRFAASKREEALLVLGQYFERKKATAEALRIYSLGSAGECREKVVRLSYARGDVDAAQHLLELMIQDPSSDDEYTFAHDFYARKFKKQRTGAQTELLRSAREIFADDIYRGSPELATIDHFENEGWTASHTENGLWTVLFALLFWDQLFEDKRNKTGPFDYYPLTLRHNSFGTVYASEILGVIAQLRAGEGPVLVHSALAKNARTSNALFYWSEDLPEFIMQMMEVMPPLALATLIEKMAGDFANTSDGFPDLTLLRGDEIKFVEVKSEGDQIQRHQMTRIRQLQDAGFAVEICRVTYRFDPNQVFVVVDLETTGGRADTDRITEIGAVKVQAGKVIGEWQSLINPERRIPSFITEITGISNEMVKDAPRFGEVAAELRGFLQGAVFAAHNVNFDYGFLAAEYRRMEQRFRYPKICTVASMRKHFPGHASYSLAAMTREYGIALKSHHRALCDAKAAAELLIMINESRQEQEAAMQGAKQMAAARDADVARGLEHAA